MGARLFALIGLLILAPLQLVRAVGANLAIMIWEKFGTITTITSIVADARQMQFALKDLF